MKTAKRILSLLLMLVMLVGLSTAAFATNGGGTVDPGGGAFGEFGDDNDGGDYPFYPPYFPPVTVETVTLTFETNGGTEIRSITVEKGSTIDLSEYITEREKYTFDGWHLDDDLTLNIAGNRLTVTEDMTIYAGWVKINPYADCPRDYTCPMYWYTDLDLHAWYHDGVHFCIENGLMGSTSTDKLIFDPNGTTTRAMIVTILWRLEGSPVVNYAMDFEDVANNLWYTEAVRWAQANEIVLGYNGKFNPNDPITREQMATIMWRYAKHKNYDVSVGERTQLVFFGDAEDVSEYAVPAMQWACGAGLITGIPDGAIMNLEPQGNTTRAQAATILYRFCENVKDN